MKILDRYLIREFLKTLAFALLAFVMIFLLVDVFENLDRFIDAHVPLAVVVSYYVYQIPYIAILTLPVAMLLASMSTTRTLARNNEIVAMKAAGISLYRIFFPLILLGLAISLAVLVAGETLVPYTNQKKGTLERKQIKQQEEFAETLLPNVLFDGTKGHLYFIKVYNTKDQSLDSVFIMVQDQTGRAVQRIDAAGGGWKNGRWELNRATVRIFRPDGTETLSYLPSLRLEEYEETPESFARRQLMPEEMGFFQLRTYIDRLTRSGGDVHRFIVDLYLKFSFPFANLIILIFGLPMLANARKSGAAMGFAVSLLVCFIFWGMLQTGRALGHNGTLPPLLAAWLPNAIFGIIGAGLMYRAPK